MKKIYLLVLILPFFFVSNVLASDIFTDTFETYSTGDITGQGTWIGGSGTWSNVSTTFADTGTKSLWIQAQNVSTYDAQATFSTVTAGTLSVRFYVVQDTDWSVSRPSIYLTNASGQNPAVVQFYGSGTGHAQLRSSNTGNIYGTVTTGAWHTLSMVYTCSGTWYHTVLIDGVDSGFGSISDGTSCTGSLNNFDRLNVNSGRSTGSHDVYFDNFGVDSGAGSSVPDTTTRIVSMTPADGSNLPSATPVTFNAHLYINPEDVGNVIKLNISLRNIDQNVLLLGDFSSETYQMFFGVATTTGDWYYSTDILLADGNYRFNIEADSCVSAFGTCLIQVPFLGIHLYENTQFIVGTSTFIGNISQNSFAQTNSIFASTTATSTSALSRTCYPFSGNFDTIQCVSFLIIPDAGYLSDTLNNFRVNVSTHFPLGYITDLYGILSTTTQGTLEVVDVTLPMFGNPHIRLDLTNVLDPILNATTSQFFNGDISSSTETFYDVTSFYWDILVYAMTVFYIIGRILGSHLIPKIRL